jgi:hypothetical protein
MILVLLEASSTMADYSHITKAGFEQNGYVNTQSKSGGVDKAQIAKSIIAFAKPGPLRDQVHIQPTEGTTLTFPNLKQTRAALKINVTTAGSTLAMWFMHANASNVGGAAAVGAVEDYLAKNSSTVVFADFNLAVEEAERVHGKNATIVRPIGPNMPLPFTNWNDQGNQLPSSATLESWGIDKHVTVNKSIKPFGIIDYAMHSDHVKVTARANAKDGVMPGSLGSLLAQFDHFPAIYQVDWPV